MMARYHAIEPGAAYAVTIYGRKITRNDCGATDADLPELFRVLDRQLARIDERFGPLGKDS